MKKSACAAVIVRPMIAASIAGALAACAPGGPRDAHYVAVEPSAAATLREAISIESNQLGMKPHAMSQTRSSRDVLYTIEAHGNGLTLWFANMPLSGKEDPSLCGPSDGMPHTDPSQYLFYVERRFPWSRQGEADRVQAILGERLRAKGYKVTSTPALCGKVALTESESL
jgi:hypothetical protein